ncbi:hypothetical protein Pmar_PMAR019603 [Perkinsus marinus ATCC 50983]|uniref:Uncharacterized protein n=1 Tax=Perkinsus marinus (strain ATCC 50983 / TXsc) TaxID=423536 RepID=C5LGJ9_PERM5|nr:hypothetical protein Pmar_PMAR019603 [Perkinsus marinus ATCC 50983]EER04185.1 hypothetical protein Pmar_PMAR019603 [Perkinsus marinus ATCC 50983]|eukprot:XP_002772369.1 hypothetical protein Pmar_PMAR019603 [Perkinsus marinus ATCC 50983]
MDESLQADFFQYLSRIGRNGVMKSVSAQVATSKSREGENNMNINFTCQAWLSDDRSCLCALATTKGFVIVWNYEDRKCEIHEKFDEEVCCVAIHPNGFGMIVALAGRIRLMNLLMDAIQPYKDLPVRNSREVKYAHGGHLFAVAGSANQVQIYKTYSAELFCTTIAGGQATMLGSVGMQEALAAAGLGGLRTAGKWISFDGA